MLSETIVSRILELGASRGADFTEVFVEESETSDIEYVQQKIDRINSGTAFGVGIRLIFGEESSYGYSSDDSEEVLLQLTANLARSAQAGTPPAVLARQDEW